MPSVKDKNAEPFLSRVYHILNAHWNSHRAFLDPCFALGTF